MATGIDVRYRYRYYQQLCFYDAAQNLDRFILIIVMDFTSLMAPKKMNQSLFLDFVGNNFLLYILVYNICFDKISNVKKIKIKTYEHFDQKLVPNFRTQASSKK